MHPGLLAFLGFAAAVTTVLGLYSIVSDVFLRDRSRVSQRVDEEFRSRQRERAQQSMLFKDLSILSLEASEALAKPNSWRCWMETLIEQSGLETTPRRILTWMGGTGLACSLFALLLFRNPLVAPPVFLLAAYVPLGYVQYKRRERLNRMLAQLADAFDLMARTIRAGHTMSQSLQAITDEFEEPIAAEFSLCFEQMNLGLSMELAMRDLARRTGLLEIKIFVLALLVQSQTGGNLAEMLDKLSGMIRDRFRIQGKIQAFTAEGRFQAIILLALPPLLFLIIMVLNRNYAAVLLAHPSLLIGMLISELVGALWIRKIISFDY